MRRTTLLFGLMVVVVGCGSSAPEEPRPSAEEAPAPVAVEEPEAPASQAPTNDITAEGMGPARLGMTLGELKQALPESDFQIQSPFMVDIDAVAVRSNDEVQFYILHLSSDALTDADSIELLMTDNASFRTAEGVGPGTPIQDAEAVYGQASLNYHTAYESRESVEFADVPYDTMSFRSDQWGRQEFAGIYAADTDGEYFVTDQYRQDATIGAVQLRGQ